MDEGWRVYGWMYMYGWDGWLYVGLKGCMGGWTDGWGKLSWIHTVLHAETCGSTQFSLRKVIWIHTFMPAYSDLEDWIHMFLPAKRVDPFHIELDPHVFTCGNVWIQINMVRFHTVLT